MAKSNQQSPRIGILGAGFSGMCAAIKLQTDLNIHDYTIFDENHDVGGTWLTHTYPGCACDVTSHVYSYSFELNPNWSTTYARQPEILAYLQGVALKYDLYSKIKFQHYTTSATWDEKIYKWRVVAHDKENGKTRESLFDILISGIGGLRVPNIPEQFSPFKNPIMHSAKWDSGVNLENKTVAVIGSGCSAVQIIPEIAPKVKRLLSFQRHPAWVTPQTVMIIPEFLKWIFAKFTPLLWLLRTFLFFTQEIKYPALHWNGLRKLVSWAALFHMKRQIPQNPSLRDKLVPNYELGCKRISPSNTYYKALDKPQCEVINDKIVAVTQHGITTEDGKEHHIDVIILATGYRVQDFFAPLKLFGTNSEDILESWKAYSPTHYLGITTSPAPNLFLLLGPNTAYGHNTVVFAIECQVNWTMQVIKEFIKQHAKLVSVTPKAEKQFMTNLRERMKGTVWGTFECGSWYANHLGINTTLYPGSLLTYWKETLTPNFSDLEFHS